MLEQEPGVIFVVRDEQAMKLDELADLCEYWKRHREKGRTPNAIRSALVTMANEIAATTAPSNAEVTGAPHHETNKE